MMVGWPVGDDSESREHTALAEARLLLAGAGLCSLSSVITHSRGPLNRSPSCQPGPPARRSSSPLDTNPPCTKENHVVKLRDGAIDRASAMPISHPSATPRHRAYDGRSTSRWPHGHARVIREVWVELLIFAGRERSSVMDDQGFRCMLACRWLVRARVCV